MKKNMKINFAGIDISVNRDPEVVPVDPSKFNDRVAMLTQWIPLKHGGANFKTHSLLPVSHSQLTFQASIGAKLFAMLFIVVGVFLVGLGIYLALTSPQTSNPSSIISVVGIVFLVLGSVIFYSFIRPIVFDKEVGYFWKGKKPIPGDGERVHNNKQALLTDIHALQILSEYCRNYDKHGHDRSYYSYELNLILQDGSRINLIDHSDIVKVQEDAKTLADFLGVPLWNAA